MKTIKIEDETHKQLKIYAAKNSIQINNWANLVIAEAIGMVKQPTKSKKQSKKKLQ